MAFLDQRHGPASSSDSSVFHLPQVFTTDTGADAPCQQGLIDQSKTKPKPGLQTVRVQDPAAWLLMQREAFQRLLENRTQPFVPWSLT